MSDVHSNCSYNVGTFEPPELLIVMNTCNTHTVDRCWLTLVPVSTAQRCRSPRLHQSWGSMHTSKECAKLVWRQWCKIIDRTYFCCCQVVFLRITLLHDLVTVFREKKKRTWWTNENYLETQMKLNYWTIDANQNV